MILDKDLMKIAENEILNTKIVVTYVGGKKSLWKIITDFHKNQFSLNINKFFLRHILQLINLIYFTLKN
ncbi:MAG: hypothetical protein WKF59_00580 [Chitinophagaceae bacterium]